MIHLGTTFIRLSGVFLCLSARILRMLCSIVYHRSNIGNRRLQLLYGACLFGCTLSQRLCCICQTSGTHGYLSGYFINIVQRFIHLILNISQRFFQFIQIAHIEIGITELHCPVAVCHSI